MAIKAKTLFCQFPKDGSSVHPDLSHALSAGELGQRGKGLAIMCALGLPVPPGFVLLATPKLKTPSTADLAAEVARLGDLTGRTFGDAAKPLLVSVRGSSTSPVPNAGDAILNIGFNDETVAGLAAATGDALFAYECYRLLIQNFAHIVWGDDPADFEEIISLYRSERGLVANSEFTTADAKELIARFKAQVKSHGEEFPQDVSRQLQLAIAALQRAWSAPRAVAQRKLHGAGETAQLAVIVQAMVFGNRCTSSGTGIATSRDEATGESQISGHYLPHAQGQDLAAAIGVDLSLEQMPVAARAALAAALKGIEAHSHDAAEVEFTVEQEKLWLLDVRAAPRTTKAALRMAVDFARNGMISREEALLRIDPLSLGQMLHATINPQAKRQVIATGLPASPGAATGVIVFDTAEARLRTASGEHVILVRPETLPEDIAGLHIAEGVLTTRGGMTSHAAVIARGMGKPCVAGAGTLRIDAVEETLSGPGIVLQKGEIITIDGSSGQIMKGEVATLQPQLSGDFATLLGWADDVRRMKVRANAETPQEAKTARNFGAEGIGLCRTEHMFFSGDRIVAIREMILADRERERREALNRLLPVLRADFVELFEIMVGTPVTLRLLDPPLHEFLPKDGGEIEAVARALGTGVTTLRKRVAELSETNPMLGHRGVRLLLSYPEITDMQARAIFEAAVDVTKRTGQAPIAEIMVPLVVSRDEFDLVKARIVAIAEEVEKSSGTKLEYHTGAMIELPRAALKANEIAASAEFFSFGTNDLTQTAFGISRDDSARFIGEYTQKGIFARDPFITLDASGVGELIEFAARRGRKTRKSIMLGICGEHGGDPESIGFCETLSLDYVSCSPFRVPIARLAAAQATIRNRAATIGANR
jgi:pyruvate,orthophosphate dikinase